MGNSVASGQELIASCTEAERTAPAPLLLTPSFFPNSSRVDDPGVKRGEMWNREHERVPAPENMRGGKLNVPLLISHEIGIAMVYYGNIESDFAVGFKYGVIGLYKDKSPEGRKPEAWGAISAWAWGLSRANEFTDYTDYHRFNAVTTAKGRRTWWVEGVIIGVFSACRTVRICP